MHERTHIHLSLPPRRPGPMASAGGSDPYGTEFVVLEPGGHWSGPETGGDVQVLVARGTVRWRGQSLGPGSFLRAAWAEGAELQSPEGCELLVKCGPGDASDAAEVAVDPARARWSPGQGNLRVLPLDARGAESTALVHWPAGERFLPHRHFGGEEIFVLSGTFRDEHGSYPAGTWIQSPHGSAHHPFVHEETRIWVKTGHLAPTAQGPRG